MGRHIHASEEGGLFSLELSSHGGSAFLRGKEAMRDSAGLADVDGTKLSCFCAPTTMFEHKLLEAVRRLKPAALVTSELDHKLLASLLASKGYSVTVHAPVPLCTCKSNSRRCLEVLSHTYIVCTGTAEYASETEVVVEPKLREQFEIAHQTAEYKRLLQDVPAEFVGSRGKLKVVVEAISAAMADAFKLQELPLPPWRRTAAALSKWGLQDVSVTSRSPSHSPEGQPAWQPISRSSRNNITGGPQRFGFPDNQEAPSGGFRDLKNTLQRISAECGDRKQAKKLPVSLLARGLADMERLQKVKRPLEGGKPASKLKRVPSWDFSGLAPITTVRRSGRVK